jgi:hypothetical protein
MREPEPVEPAVRAGAISDAASQGQSAPPHKPIGTLFENVGESATACMITMLQGNLLAMTWTHWVIASRTGLISGSIATAAILVAGKRGRVFAAIALLLATLLGDYFTHPSHFLGPLAEPAVTAVAAAVLSFIVGKALEIRRHLKRARQLD